MPVGGRLGFTLGFWDKLKGHSFFDGCPFVCSARKYCYFVRYLIKPYLNLTTRLQMKEIKDLLDLHKSYTPFLRNLLEGLLRDEHVKIQKIEHRTKELESVEEKIERKSILNPTETITDLSGIRIILFYPEDIRRAEEIVKREFAIDFANSMDKSEEYNEHEFGYLSVHYIVSLDENRVKLNEYKKYTGLKAEIQIRTVLQHAWASVSHELEYKKEYDIPRELKRRLYRLAGLFELADEEFSALKQSHAALNNKIETAAESDEISDENLNLLTAKQYFEQENNTLIALKEIVKTTGFTLQKHVYREDISKLLLAAKLNEIKTVKELEENLAQNRAQTKDLLQDIRNAFDGKEWKGNIAFFALIILLNKLSEEKRKTFKQQTEWVKTVWETVNKNLS